MASAAAPELLVLKLKEAEKAASTAGDAASLSFAAGLALLTARYCQANGGPVVEIKEAEDGKVEPELVTSSEQLTGGIAISKFIASIAPPSVASSLLGASAEASEEVTTWLATASDVESKGQQQEQLPILNGHLATRAVVAGGGTRLSLADVAWFCLLQKQIASLSAADLIASLPHVARWFDLCQHKLSPSGLTPPWVQIPKLAFNPPPPTPPAPAKPAAAKEAEGGKSEKKEGTREDKDASKAAANERAAAGKEGSKGAGKKAKDNQPAADASSGSKKDSSLDVSILNILVGQIKKVWKHPGADALYVEEIDVGEAAPRQIVSGLAKFLTEEEMMNRRVLVLANVKPGKVRDVMSSGLVLCASNEDHSQCQPVEPPAAAAIGEKVTFEGYTGKPEDQLNSKKKHFEKLQPELKTNDDGIATFSGTPFLTSAGPCTSQLKNAFIK